MNASQQDPILLVHNKVPNRLRVRVPLIKHKQTFAELLKQGLLRDADAKGIYHAEPSIVTGTILIKYHPALHTEEDVLQIIQRVVGSIANGKMEISAKHKNPRLGKMRPGAFFTRELIVSIVGNVLAGLILAAIVTG
ncbi:MAG TPA: hypothetical protein VLG46_03800 [Anaerolineae bacterium]|nr:hypothetical protein [Anaerolineae bacterium]